ncbi:MAG: electron transport complex subunit RsxE [Candidatus Woesearchaeota archaeon]
MNGSTQIFLKGIISRNPVFVIMLGLCSTLAITTSLENALGMSVATIFVLVASNVLISSLRNLVPSKVRMPIFVVIIATFVTVASLVMEAYSPSLYDRLGIYVPLIVVNCIIMARAEAFAYKNSVPKSLLDGLGMGIGFGLAICLIAVIREILGTAKLSLLGHAISLGTPGIGLFLLPPGAYLVMGLLIVLFKKLGEMNWKTS